MQPRSVVYVSRITNLSDARYCAGMGVDIIGFVVDPTHPDYVSPQAYQEMVGWISGPKRAIELITLPATDINATIALYLPDYIHVDQATATHLKSSGTPWLVEIHPDKGRVQLKPGLAAFQIAGVEQMDLTDPSIPRLVILNDVAQIPTDVAGIALKGTKEISPGLKDYDHLSTILEQLENRND
ncbi:MAG: hypothetical protein JNK10_08935 [Cyclobacteriaceae bacterium]|nr:hypothetical protein [Cyclobacteriaceae bacterium]